MYKIPKAILTLAVIIISLSIGSCSSEKVINDNPLNAIINIREFSYAAAETKYQKSVPIKKEDLYGDWTMISSFFTLRKQKSISSLEFEGRKYKIEEDGTLTITIPNRFLFFSGKVKENWKLELNNTVFNNNHVRINGNVMEWIQKVDDDYIYFVLVK